VALRRVVRLVHTRTLIKTHSNGPVPVASHDVSEFLADCSTRWSLPCCSHTSSRQLMDHGWLMLGVSRASRRRPTPNEASDANCEQTQPLIGGHTCAIW
jgi:hypothetical protein